MKEERENSRKSRQLHQAALSAEQEMQQRMLRLKGLAPPPDSDSAADNSENNSNSNNNSAHSANGDSSAHNASTNEASDFSIEKLLKSPTSLQRGIDPMMLGTSFAAASANQPLTAWMASPWSETSRSEVEPVFTSPASFQGIMPKIPLEQRLSSFNDQTLFYIFYTKSRDSIQELVARELNERNWKYHKELQVWLTKDPNSEPRPMGPLSEEGCYIFFDPMNWDYVTKRMTLYYQCLSNIGP